MDDSEFKTLLNDFMHLKFNYTDFNKQYNYIRDLPLSYLILGRMYNNSFNIYCIESNIIITIPIQWINLFTDLNNYSALRSISFTTGNEELLSKNFITLCSYLSNFSGDIINLEYIRCINDILTTGTKSFREMMKIKYELNLSPIEYLTKNENIEI